MSLKAFHIVFVCVCILLTLFVAVWGIRDYDREENTASLLLAGLSLISTVLLALYGRWFLKKLRGVGYL